MNYIKLNVLIVTFLSAFSTLSWGQENAAFPLDPYLVLKTWTFEDAERELGPAGQIIDTIRKQAYIAGYRYETEWFGRKGSLELYFSPAGISRFQFIINYPVRELSAELEEKIRLDTLVRNAHNKGVFMQDSLRRDSLIKAVSLVLGEPFNSGPTPAADRSAKFASAWFKNGYVCTLRDQGLSIVISFALAKTPDWAVREFDLPENGNLICREKVSQKRMAYNASLLAIPSSSGITSYDGIFLLLEFDSGQRFAESLPSLPRDALLPKIYFDDLTGDAIFEVWITVPLNLPDQPERHYFYSLIYKDPQIIFDTDYSLPSEIHFQKDYNLEIVFPDGTALKQTLPRKEAIAGFYLPDGNLKSPVSVFPEGFYSLIEKERKRDGSVELEGLVALPRTEQGDAGFVSITYRYINGGWEPATSQFKD